MVIFILSLIYDIIRHRHNYRESEIIRMSILHHQTTDDFQYLRFNELRLSEPQHVLEKLVLQRKCKVV